MKRPERKPILQKGDFNTLSDFDYTIKTGIHIGWNQACEGWEKHLKSEGYVKLEDVEIDATALHKELDKKFAIGDFLCLPRGQTTLVKIITQAKDILKLKEDNDKKG